MVQYSIIQSDNLGLLIDMKMINMHAHDCNVIVNVYVTV